MADVVESKEQVLIRFRDKELRGCTIKKLWLQGISLVGADLSDVTFEDCSSRRGEPDRRDSSTEPSS
jgi:hypothetical protein